MMLIWFVSQKDLSKTDTFDQCLIWNETEKSTFLQIWPINVWIVITPYGSDRASSFFWSVEHPGKFYF